MNFLWVYVTAKDEEEARDQINTWKADTDKQLSDHKKKLADPNVDVGKYRTEYESIVKRRENAAAELTSQDAQNFVSKAIEDRRQADHDRMWWASEKASVRQRISRFKNHSDQIYDVCKEIKRLI